MRHSLLLAFFAVAIWGSFTRPAFPQALLNPSVDVVLALDNSGSMKQNDPNSLMRQAVSQFAARMPPDSRLGIVLFDQRVRSVMDLLPASDPQFRPRVAASLDLLDYRGQWTDIPGGVERSIYALRQASRPNVQPVIVLFTDGMVETGNPTRDIERARWLRENLAAEAKQLGIRIFGIAFTETADFELMQSLAGATGGAYFRVLAASDISSSFAQISARLRDLGRVAQPPSPPPPPPLWWRQWPYQAAGALLVVGLVALVWRLSRGTGSSAGRPSVAAHLRDLGNYTGLEVLPLDKLALRVGRDEANNDIVIAQDTISTKHAVIEFRDGAFYVRDLRSSNGSFLNGKQFSDPNEIREVVLKHGDKLRFDAFEFEFIEDALESVDKTRLVNGAAAGLGMGAGGTRLRGGPPVVMEPPAPVYAAAPKPADPAGPLPTIHKPLEAEGADGPATRLKPDMCPHHPAWKATELCPVCRVPKCKSCMTQKDGQPICSKCAAQQAA